jgi:hypothetical protein
LNKLALLFAVAAVAIASACGGDHDKKTLAPTAARAPATTPAASALGNFTFVGFADHIAPGNFAPSDVTPGNGTIRACNPPSLYAFVNFTGLTPPKTMTGRWTLNGAQIGTNVINQTQAQANTFWQVQNTPAALAAGAYVIEVSIDGTVVSRGQFTLVC